MRTWMLLTVLFLSQQYGSSPASAPAAPTAPANQTAGHLPVYTADGQMQFPSDYREWVYVTSGIDMNYGPGAAMPGHSNFDNVFVTPEAYKAFLQSGNWPDKTVFVLEVRAAGSKGSINKNGHFQTPEIVGRETHVKDSSRFPGNWAFFAFGDASTAKPVAQEAACYSCHGQNGAVDTTFVQFYPTLKPVAQKFGTYKPPKEDTP